MTEDERLWAGYARAAISGYAAASAETELAPSLSEKDIELAFFAAHPSDTVANYMLIRHRERWPAPAVDLDLAQRCMEAEHILQRLVDLSRSLDGEVVPLSMALFPALIDRAQIWLDCGEKGEGE